MSISARVLGYPDLRDVVAMGLTGSQFFDVVKWMNEANCPRWWELKKSYPVPGWEVVSFLREMERPR